MSLSRKEKSFLYALHPRQLPASGLRLTYTFGLGGISVLAAVMTALSGVALTLYYVPTPAEAHDSLVLIEDVVAFGGFMRGLHFWAAQLMLVAATLHLARVVFTGAYRPPRELNWLVGVGLLVLTLLWDFSGYVLRWDEGAHWALLIGTNLVREVPLLGEALYRALVGDVLVGASALLRFYAWHVVGLTFLAGLGIVYHLWRLRQDGGISRPPLPDGVERALVGREQLLAVEATATALVCAGLVLLATFLAVPLGPPANLLAGVGEVQAPWLFLWVQGLLRWLPPLWAGVILPLAALLVLAALPWLDRRGPGRGVWFARERWRPQALFTLLALLIVCLSLLEALR